MRLSDWLRMLPFVLLFVFVALVGLCWAVGCICDNLILIR